MTSQTQCLCLHLFFQKWKKLHSCFFHVGKKGFMRRTLRWENKKKLRLMPDPLCSLARSPCSQAFGLVDSGARQVALKAFGRVIKTLPEGNLHFSPSWFAADAANTKAVNGGWIAAGGAASVLIPCLLFCFPLSLPLHRATSFADC